MNREAVVRRIVADIPMRQTARRKLFAIAMANVNEHNLAILGTNQGMPCHFNGMKRAERRKLARAYFSKSWREKKSVSAA